MKVAVWSPLPPSGGETARQTASLLPALAQLHEIVAVVEDPALVDRDRLDGLTLVDARSVPDDVDLDLYTVSCAPDHVFVYRAAMERPGVVILHDWILHDLVWREAAEAGDVFRYLRAMRYSHGATGTFVGHQVVRGRGGRLLPELLAVNDQLIAGCLGVVTATREGARRCGRRHPEVPCLHLPQHLALPASLPSRAEARQALGLPGDALILTAMGSGTATSDLEALLRAATRLRGELPSLRLVVVTETLPDPPVDEWEAAAGLAGALVVAVSPSVDDRVSHLVAADLVSALRFPPRGGMWPTIVQALGIGRPVLVTAGSPAADEIPEGAVVAVDPGPRQAEDLVAHLRRLLSDEGLREEQGATARRYSLEHLGLEPAAAHLARFLDEVQRGRAEGSRDRPVRPDTETLGGYLTEEVLRPARDVGLPGARRELEARLASLMPGQPAPD